MSIITERVNALCALRNVSISKLERGIGCANGTIRNWFERDSYPKIDNLISVADFLDTTVAYIIGETDNPRKGKLIVDGTSNIWDYLLPLTRDECQWISVKRFVESRSKREMDDEELEKQINAVFDTAEEDK